VSSAFEQAGQRQPVTRFVVLGSVLAAATLLAACQSPPHEARTFYDFKEDSVARDGVLLRCDKDRDATAGDLECIAARRAGAAVALEQERSRAGALQQQSDRKLVALRGRAGGEADAGANDAAASAFGAPIGSKLPSMTESADPYDVQFPGRPTFKLGDVQPPASEIEIERPQLTPEDVAVVPLRIDAAN
jgi:hypothetical protein